MVAYRAMIDRVKLQQVYTFYLYP